MPAGPREPVINLAGATSLGGLLALLQRAKLLVTNDSGPMHLADALGTKIVSLWGPSSPQSYGNWSPRHRMIYRNVYCSPCLLLVDKPPCQGDNQCMKGIRVREVAEAALSVLGQSMPSGLAVPEPQTALRGEQLGVVRLREGSLRGPHKNRAASVDRRPPA